MQNEGMSARRWARKGGKGKDKDGKGKDGGKGKGK